MQRIISRRQWLSIWLVILVTALSLTPAYAQNSRGESKGKYAHLTALWWQWVTAQPAMDINGTNSFPILDSTGEFAAVGQENGIGPANKYFFLAGNFGGDTLRTVTVPAGKVLFFPILNLLVDNAVEPPTNNTVPQLRAIVHTVVDATTSTYARLNGAPVEIFAVASPTFSYTVPDENSFYDYFGLVGPQFEGTIHPAVSDGYWAVVPPLAPGHYTLAFGGTLNNGFALNVTYYLTIQ